MKSNSDLRMREISYVDLYFYWRLICLSKNHNEMASTWAEDFRGYSLPQVGLNSSYSTTKIRNHLEALIARGLVRKKMINKTNYYFLNLEVRVPNEKAIKKILDEKVMKFAK